MTISEFSLDPVIQTDENLHVDQNDNKTTSSKRVTQLSLEGLNTLLSHPKNNSTTIENMDISRLLNKNYTNKESIDEDNNTDIQNLKNDKSISINATSINNKYGISKSSTQNGHKNNSTKKSLSKLLDSNIIEHETNNKIIDENDALKKTNEHTLELIQKTLETPKPPKFTDNDLNNETKKNKTVTKKRRLPKKNHNENENDNENGKKIKRSKSSFPKRQAAPITSNTPKTRNEKEDENIINNNDNILKPISDDVQVEKGDSIKNDGDEPKEDKVKNSEDETDYGSDSENDTYGKGHYCLCNGPDDGSFMVCCDECEEWYHGRCIKITKDQGSKISKFVCPKCKADGKGNTEWKRICRLPGCDKLLEPHKGKHSKYCCQKHGVKFFKDQLFNQTRPEKVAIDLHDLSAVVSEISYGRFKQLGTFGEDLVTANKMFRGIEEERVNEIQKEILRLNDRKKYNQEREHYLRHISIRRTKKLNELMTVISGGKKKDICGFDRRLQLEEDEWSESVPIWKKLKLKIEKITRNDLEAALEQKESSITDENDLSSVCLKEKRKCDKHNGWQELISRDCWLDDQTIETTIDKLTTEKKNILKVAVLRTLDSTSTKSKVISL